MQGTQNLLTHDVSDASSDDADDEDEDLSDDAFLERELSMGGILKINIIDNDILKYHFDFCLLH